MALFDSADLLARCKELADRPATDESMTDTNWYSLLTEAQVVWYHNFAQHVPWMLVEAPVLLTSADSGETYTFASGITPVYVELYTAKDGRLMRAGAYWDTNADYVWEGSTVRFPSGKTKTFSSGPYARIITPPAEISAATEPTLVPKSARILLVYHAVAQWAKQGNKRDPKPFTNLEREAWFGDGSTTFGILGMLKLQNPLMGTAAYSQASLSLQDIDDGTSYTPL